MVRSWDRFLCSIGCVFVCKRYFEGFSTHHLQFLMRTCVKRTRRVTFLDLFLNLLSISIGHGASLVPLYFVESSDWVMFETDATGNSLSTMFMFLRAVSDKYILDIFTNLENFLCFSEGIFNIYDFLVGNSHRFRCGCCSMTSGPHTQSCAPVSATTF